MWADWSVAVIRSTAGSLTIHKIVGVLSADRVTFLRGLRVLARYARETTLGIKGTVFTRIWVHNFGHGKTTFAAIIRARSGPLLGSAITPSRFGGTLVTATGCVYCNSQEQHEK